MRFHPTQSNQSKLLLKLLSPILLILAIFCYLNSGIVYRSLVDVNIRSSYMTFLDAKFQFIEFFSSKSDSLSKREDLVVKMSPNNYVLFQKERAKNLYKRLLFDFQDSIYGVDARKRYREMDKTTTEKEDLCELEYELAATNSLSEASFVAPYKLIGLLALSVERATTFLIPLSIQASMTFIAPLIFVLIHSNGLYSAVGTILVAAA